MPIIPQYRRDKVSLGRLEGGPVTIPRIPPAIHAEAASFSSGGGQAAEALGEAFGITADFAGQILEHQEKMRQQDEVNYVFETEKKFADQWLGFSQGEISKVGKDTYGNLDRARQWIAENEKSYLDEAPSDEVRTLLKDKFGRLTRPMINRLASLHSGERKKVHKVSLDNLKETKRKEAYLDPDNAALWVNDMEATYNGALASEMLDEETRDGLIRQTTGGIYGAALDGLLDRDPKEAIRRFDAGQYNEFLTSKQLDYYADKIRVEKRRLDTESRIKQREAEQARKERVNDLRPLMQDELSSVLNTGKRLQGMDIAGELEGLDQELAAEYKTNLQRQEEVHFVLAEMKFSPLKERVETIERYRPEPGASDFKAKQEMYGFLSSALAKDWNRFEKDPVSYLSPKVETKIQGLINSGAIRKDDNASIVQARIRESVRFQGEMGIPEHKQNILSGLQIEDMKTQYEKGDPKEKIAFIQNLSSFGEYRPSVLSELDLGYEHTYAAELSPYKAETIIQVMDMKDNDFGLKPDEKETLTKEANEAFYGSDNMGKTLSAIGTITGNPEYLKMTMALEGITKRTAWLFHDSDKANKFLWEEDFGYLIDEDLAFVYFDKSYDPDEVEEFLLEKRQDVEKHVNHKRGKFQSEKEYEQYLDDLKDKGVWIPHPAGSGFILIDHVTGKAVTNKEGGYIQVDLVEIKETF